MATFIWSSDQRRMVDKATGEPMVADRAAPVACPQVYSDLPGYQSPIDGRWIEGRRARRYDMEINNCIDANEVGSPTKGKLRNRAFAEKRGLQHKMEQ